MSFTIEPEPSPDERRVLAEVLNRMLGVPDERESEWWRRGVRENVLGDEREGPAP